MYIYVFEFMSGGSLTNLQRCLMSSSQMLGVSGPVGCGETSLLSALILGVLFSKESLQALKR